MRNLGLIVALWLAAILPTSSLALGLGEIEVNSFLNQPLNAKIEVLSARAGEIDDLLVSLGSRVTHFTRAGLARPRHLSDLKFAVNKSEDGESGSNHCYNALCSKRAIPEFPGRSRLVQRAACYANLRYCWIRPFMPISRLRLRLSAEGSLPAATDDGAMVEPADEPARIRRCRPLSSDSKRNRANRTVWKKLQSLRSSVDGTRIQSTCKQRIRC